MKIFDLLIKDLPYISKLTVRAVFNQTNNFLNMHNLFPRAQSAYREFHSTETALLRVKNDILMHMNSYFRSQFDF